MENIQESVVLVDESDREIGLEEKLVAHQKGLLHRAFSICIFRRRHGYLELLLQQRALNKYHAAGLWTNTCCSHPRHQEPLPQAALRRLKEEMGFCTELTFAGSFIYRASLPEGLIEHEFDHVFFGWVDESQPIAINPLEVASYSWISPEDLIKDLSLHQERYTPWLSQALQLALSKLESAMV